MGPHVGHAQHFFLRLADIEILLPHDLEDLVELDGKILTQDELADIVEDPGRERLAGDAIGEPARQQFGSHAAGDRMLPEFLPVELAVVALTGKPLEHRDGQTEILDRLETQDNYRQVNGGDFPGETVEGGVGQLENLGRKRLIGGYELGDVAG